MKRWYFGLGIAAAVAVLAGSIAVGAVITQAAPPFQQPTTGQNRVSLGVGLDDRTGKVIVREVRANSPAAAAGLKVDDQIASVNGTNVTTARQAEEIVRALKENDKVTIGIVRGGQSSTLTATLTAQAAPAYLGVMLDDASGRVVVRQVVADSPAAKAGVKVDDQITSVNGTNVTTASQATEIVRSKKVGDTISLGINRGGQNSTVQAQLVDQPQRTQGPGFQLPKALQGQPTDFASQRGSTRSYADSTGKTVIVTETPGKVASVDNNAKKLTLTPNAGGSTTYDVNADTAYRGITALTDLKAGDEVTVMTISTNGTTAIVISKRDANGRGGFGGPGAGGPPAGAPQGGGPGGPFGRR